MSEGIVNEHPLEDSMRRSVACLRLESYFLPQRAEIMGVFLTSPSACISAGCRIRLFNVASTPSRSTNLCAATQAPCLPTVPTLRCPTLQSTSMLKRMTGRRRIQFECAEMLRRTSGAGRFLNQKVRPDIHSAARIPGFWSDSEQEPFYQYDRAI
jgi:hypothetical protein